MADPKHPADSRLAPSAALTAQSSLETLEAAYAQWREEKLRYAAARARLVEQRRRLDDEAAFLVGAVRAAGTSAPPGPPDALAAPGGLEAFVREAEERILRTRQQLEARALEEEAAFAQTFTGLRQTVVARVERILARTRPALRLVPRRLGGDQRILHLDRLSDDGAILLLFVLCGKIPSRYGFLLDDSTDQMLLPPAPLYPDEGVAPDQTRPDAAGLRQVVEGASPVLPIKGFVPVPVPRGEGPPAFYRLLQRGAVMEVELQDGAGFRNVLTREESERFAGYLLACKLAGKLELELASE